MLSFSFFVSICQNGRKKRLVCILFLHISEKSSTFAPHFMRLIGSTFGWLYE